MPKPDGRADWCAINQLHGPHGEKAKGGPCPGYNPKPTRSPEMTETTRVRRKDVEEALARLSQAAIALGMRNRYEIEFGSRTNGVSHVLLDYDPAFAHAHRTPIGRDFRSVFQIITGMAMALESAIREAKRQEAIVLSGRMTSEELYASAARAGERRTAERAVFADPDARSARRATEERALPTLPRPEDVRGVSASEAVSMVRPGRTRPEPDGLHPVKPV